MNAIHTSVQGFLKNCGRSFLRYGGIHREVKGREIESPVDRCFLVCVAEMLEIYMVKESTILSNISRQETHISLPLSPQKVTSLGGDATVMGDPAG